MNLQTNLFKRALLLSLPLIISLSSCYNYKPGYINSPTFSEKDELYVDLNVGSQFGGNISYSPIKNWGVLLNAGRGFTNEIESGNEAYVNQNREFVDVFNYRNFFYELATGVYVPLSEGVYFDFYGGYGKGTAGASRLNSNFFTGVQDLVAFQNNFENIFFQSDLKFQLADDLKLNINGRMNVLNFQDFKYVYRRAGNLNNQNSPLPPQDEINRFFSPNQRIAYQLGLGFEGDADYFIITAQVQFGISDYQYDEDLNFYSVRPFSVFVGISVPFHRMWKSD